MNVDEAALYEVLLAGSYRRPVMAGYLDTRQDLRYYRVGEG
jgi:hypothetical protein